MNPLAQAAWLALPVTLGGLTHVAAIKGNLFGGLADFRLDVGVTVRGRPLFGANKTLRGALVMIAATVVWVAAVDAAGAVLGIDHLRYVPTSTAGSAAFGLLLGAAYILGELPNSFLKRQLGIEPGQPARGALEPVFWALDQVDSALGVLLALCVFHPPTLAFATALLGLTLLLHPAVAALMVLLGLKGRLG